METQPLSTRIRDFYSVNVAREWRRLARDAYHQLEYLTSMRYMQKYLPPTGHLLDAGGGPGRYTIGLAKAGYDVTLLDLTPANLEFARRRIARSGVRRRVKDMVEGSICDLSRYPADSFDAVLCTGGPLSHVVDAGERNRAIDEMIRVAKPGAPLFVSVMSRLSVLKIILYLSPEEITMPHFAALRETGHYMGENGFTACHFFDLEELRAAFEGKSVSVLEMVGLEGISSHHRKQLNAVARHPQRWAAWLETHYATCTHPAVVATSEHMMIVCRKKE